MSGSEKKKGKIISRLRFPSFPLLAKEMIELSNQSRTYSIRIFYAIIIYCVSIYLFLQVLEPSVWITGYGILGTGENLFRTVYLLQILGICIFVPALTCNIITSEKESGNFPLLLITNLGPGKIVLEKLLSRVIQFGTVLLLALPLMAYSYVLGGVPVSSIWSSSILLFLCVLQLASFSIMCSCCCRSNMAAFVMTYFLGVIIQFFIPFMIFTIFYPHRFGGAGSTAVAVTYFLSSFFSAPLICLLHAEETRAGVGVGMGVSSGVFAATYVGIVTSIIFYLLMAKRFLISRAFVAGGSMTLQVFKIIDVKMKQLNENKITRGIVLIGDGSKMPETDPVKWRETTKTALGATRYLVRLLVAIELPLCLFITFSFAVAVYARTLTPMLHFFYYLFWGLSVVLIIAKASNLIAGEQANQTLDVLLSTPMRTEDILRQKFVGIKRLFWVLSMPIITVIVVEWFYSIRFIEYFRFSKNRPAVVDWERVVYEVMTMIIPVLALIIFFHIVMYLTVWISMQLKKTLRTMLLTILIIGLCAVTPFIVPKIFPDRYSYNLVNNTSLINRYVDYGDIADMVWFMGPMEILRSDNFLYEEGLKKFIPYKFVILLLFYIPIAILLKKLCYRKILRSLGRPEGDYAGHSGKKKEVSEPSKLSMESA